MRIWFWKRMACVSLQNWVVLNESRELHLQTLPLAVCKNLTQRGLKRRPNLKLEDESPLTSFCAGTVTKVLKFAVGCFRCHCIDCVCVFQEKACWTEQRQTKRLWCGDVRSRDNLSRSQAQCETSAMFGVQLGAEQSTGFGVSLPSVVSLLETL